MYSREGEREKKRKSEEKKKRKRARNSRRCRNEARPDYPVVGHGHGRLARSIEWNRGDGDDDVTGPTLSGLRTFDGILPGAVRDRARAGERGERHQRASTEPDDHRLQDAAGRQEEPGGGDAADSEVSVEATALGAATRRAQRRGDAPHGRFRGLRIVQGSYGVI